MDEMERVPSINGNSTQSNGDYFSSYDDLNVHHLMVFDKPRTEAYREAILGNRHLFQDKVVLDVGAGTGILSVLAAEAGARRVYAAEASSVHQLTRAVAAANGLQAVIHVLAGPVEQLQLPEQVDVILSEWMGFYLLHESMLSSVIIARDRFLKPHGVMFPDVAELYVCPSTLSTFHADRLACWSSVHGVNMSPVADAVRQQMQREPQVVLTHPEELLSSPELVARLHLLYISDAELSSFTCRRFVTARRDGLYRGLCLWFTCRFPGGSHVITTSPQAPPTHWQHTAVVLPRDYALETGEVLGFELRLVRSAESARRYVISLDMLDEEDEHPVPCGCAVGKCRLIKALMDKEEAEMEEG